MPKIVRAESAPDANVLHQQPRGGGFSVAEFVQVVRKDAEKSRGRAEHCNGSRFAGAFGVGVPPLVICISSEARGGAHSSSALWGTQVQKVQPGPPRQAAPMGKVQPAHPWHFPLPAQRDVT